MKLTTSTAIAALALTVAGFAGADAASATPAPAVVQTMQPNGSTWAGSTWAVGPLLFVGSPTKPTGTVTYRGSTWAGRSWARVPAGSRHAVTADGRLFVVPAHATFVSSSGPAVVGFRRT